MKNKITCFIPGTDQGSLASTVSSLKASGVVGKVYVVVPEGQTSDIGDIEGDYITAPGFSSTAAIKKMAELAEDEFTITYSKNFPLEPGQVALSRMMKV
ncbi:MAG: hypothetical protein MUC30_05685, partial [Bacteroidales bacterium]|nr:hypothetical protein [Bacteroidales bacterium]